MTRFLAVAALVLFILSAKAGEINTAATADREVVRLSESVTVTVIVEADAPLRVEPDREILNEATAEVWRARPIGLPTVEDLPNNRKRWSQRYRLDPYVPGKQTIDFEVLKVFAGVSLDPVTVNGPSVEVRVDTIYPGNSSQEAQAIEGVEQVPPPPEKSLSLVRTLVLAAVSIGFVVLAAVLVYLRLRRKPVPLSLRQRAIGELEQLENPDVSEAAFTERLVEAVRNLVGNATATTAELLPTVNGELREDLEAVLSRCDLAKFAGMPVAAEEREPLLKNARRIVAATEPVAPQSVESTS
jgi:hypothetical protein